jgi:hypothetical protein
VGTGEQPHSGPSPELRQNSLNRQQHWLLNIKNNLRFTASWSKKKQKQKKQKNKKNKKTKKKTKKPQARSMAKVLQTKTQASDV